MSFLPIIFGVPLALSTCFLYARFASHEMQEQPYFNTAITIYAVAALWELLCEPFYNRFVSVAHIFYIPFISWLIRAMAELQTNVRVRAEGLGITGKSLTTFLLLLYNTRRGKDDDLALVAFAAGQLMYGLVVLFVYIAHFGDQRMWPKRPSTSRYSHCIIFRHPKLILSSSFL